MITWGLNMGTFGKHGNAFLWTIAHKGMLTTIVVDDHFRLIRECRYLLTLHMIPLMIYARLCKIKTLYSGCHFNKI